MTVCTNGPSVHFGLRFSSHKVSFRASKLNLNTEHYTARGDGLRRRSDRAAWGLGRRVPADRCVLRRRPGWPVRLRRGQIG